MTKRETTENGDLLKVTSPFLKIAHKKTDFHASNSENLEFKQTCEQNCLLTKNDQTLFVDQQFSLLDSLLDRVESCLIKFDVKSKYV